MLRLLSLSLLFSRVQAKSCPGVLRDSAPSPDLHYVTSESEMESLNWCRYDDWRGTAGTVWNYTCRLGHWSYCKGLLIGPEYVFWNDTAKDFLPTPNCENDFIASCKAADMDAACVKLDNNHTTTNSVFSNSSRWCKRGEFICRSKVSRKWCRGSVARTESVKTPCPAHTNGCEDGAVDCPPRTISSFAEMGAYCRYGSTEQSGNTYKCYMHWGGKEHTICKGKVDNKMVPPACSHTISSCADEDYYEVCDATRLSRKNCDSDSSGSFSCWDEDRDRWCRGQVVPSNGTWENPVCPDDTTITDCEGLQRWGIHHKQCSCANSRYGPQHQFKFGPFHCKTSEDESQWCRGGIAPALSRPDSWNGTCPPPIVSSCDEVSNICGENHKCYTGLRQPDNFWLSGAYGCWTADSSTLVCTGLMKRKDPKYPPCPRNLTFEKAWNTDLRAELGCSMRTEGRRFGFGSFSCEYPNGHKCEGVLLPENVHPNDAVECPPFETSSWADVKRLCGEHITCFYRSRSGTSGSGYACSDETFKTTTFDWSYYKCELPDDPTVDTCYGIVNFTADGAPMLGDRHESPAPATQDNNESALAPPAQQHETPVPANQPSASVQVNAELLGPPTARPTAGNGSSASVTQELPGGTTSPRPAAAVLGGLLVVGLLAALFIAKRPSSVATSRCSAYTDVVPTGEPDSP